MSRIEFRDGGLKSSRVKEKEIGCMGIKIGEASKAVKFRKKNDFRFD